MLDISVDAFTEEVAQRFKASNSITIQANLY